MGNYLHMYTEYKGINEKGRDPVFISDFTSYRIKPHFYMFWTFENVLLQDKGICFHFILWSRKFHSAI